MWCLIRIQGRPCRPLFLHSDSAKRAFAVFSAVHTRMWGIANPFQYLLLSIISETPADDFYDDLPNNHSHLYFASFLLPSVSLLRVLMFPTRSAFRTSFHLIFLKAANIYCTLEVRGCWEYDDKCACWWKAVHSNFEHTSPKCGSPRRSFKLVVVMGTVTTMFNMKLTFFERKLVEKLWTEALWTEII